MTAVRNLSLKDAIMVLIKTTFLPFYDESNLLYLQFIYKGEQVGEECAINIFCIYRLQMLLSATKGYCDIANVKLLCQRARKVVQILRIADGGLGAKPQPMSNFCDVSKKKPF